VSLVLRAKSSSGAVFLGSFLESSWLAVRDPCTLLVPTRHGLRAHLDVSPNGE
jgi:hypothetical protein